MEEEDNLRVRREACLGRHAEDSEVGDEAGGWRKNQIEKRNGKREGDMDEQERRGGANAPPS